MVVEDDAEGHCGYFVGLERWARSRELFKAVPHQRRLGWDLTPPSVSMTTSRVSRRVQGRCVRGKQEVLGGRRIIQHLNLRSGRWQYKREKESSIETDFMQEGLTYAGRGGMTGKNEGVLIAGATRERGCDRESRGRLRVWARWVS